MLSYLIYTGTLIAIYATVTLAYALPVGYTGMLNFGHIGLLAVGAYTGAILMTAHGVPFWLALAAAGLLTGAVGFLLALPARRIKDEYYALMTLGSLFVVNAVILNWSDVTGGPFGISGIHRPASFASPESYFILTLAIFAVSAFFVYRLVRSPFGRALEAVRDDDVVAESLGKHSAKLRIIALVVSAVIVGIAGAELACFIQFINAQVFWLDNAVFVLSALVLGGLASFPGAITGTVLLFIFLEAIRFLPFAPDVLGPLRLMLFSALLLVVVLVRPKGLMGKAQLD